jgi:putative phosphoribosyl transferase
MFDNRRHAGKLLSDRVKLDFGGEGGQSLSSIVVVGLPRGGIIVAAAMAQELGVPLDILVSKKITAPGNPELATGAVSSAGVVVWDNRVSYLQNLFRDSSSLQEEQKEKLTRITQESERFFAESAGLIQRPLKRASMPSTTVIIVDDGIATGMTALAALKTIRQLKPYKLILATPVIPYDTYTIMKLECDLLIALSIPIQFSAVGFFYKDFRQVEDDEVVAALKEANLVTENRSYSPMSE